MKTLGLVGGTSWVSTIDYYTIINEGINEELGDLNYSKCILYSFNFQEIISCTQVNDWESVLEKVSLACKKLELSGAEGIVLCANTLHFIADELETRLNIPLLHIARETAIEIHKQKVKKVGLLGTKFTMENDFFKTKLSEKNIEALIPESEDREFIHQSLLYELGKGIIKNTTKQRYLSIIEKLKARGVEGIIAGCTEIPLIVNDSDIDLTYFDTTKIHAKSAIQFSLSK